MSPQLSGNQARIPTSTEVEEWAAVAHLAEGGSTREMAAHRNFSESAGDFAAGDFEGRDQDG